MNKNKRLEKNRGGYNPLRPILWIIGIFLLTAIVFDYIIDYEQGVFTWSGLATRHSDHSVIWSLLPIIFMIIVFFVWHNKCRYYWQQYLRRAQREEKPGNSRPSTDIERLVALLNVPTRTYVRFLAYTMLLIWSVGWVLFYFAIIPVKHNAGGIGGLLLYSAASSLDMFMFDINGNIISECSSRGLKCLLMITSIIAVMTTVAMIMSLFLSRFLSHSHIKRLVKREGGYEEVYVFFGVNEPSKMLKESIKARKKDESEKGGKPENYLIVFVETARVDENDNDGWHSVVSAFTQPKQTFSSVNLDDNEALVVSATPITEEINPNEDLWEQLDLSQSIGKIMRDKESKGTGHIYYFFLSEDRDANVQGTINLVESKNIRETQIATTIYCQTRSGSLSRNLENSLPHQPEGKDEEEPDSKIVVKVIDNSQLSVSMLRSNKENHPVRFVDIDTRRNYGTVSSAFTSLVVGFGETGQDMVRFIYEFGAFVSSKSTEEETKRSRFRCHVVDSRMGELAGRFEAENPGFKTPQNECDNMGDPLIEFHSCDYRSREFYHDIVIRYAQDLNYVVVALGDDETNMCVAIDILKLGSES